jgi:hypothetical protein
LADWSSCTADCPPPGAAAGLEEGAAVSCSFELHDIAITRTLAATSDLILLFIHNIF